MKKVPIGKLLVLLSLAVVLLAACDGAPASGSSNSDPVMVQLTTDTGFWIDTTGTVQKSTVDALKAESNAIEKDGFQLGGAFFNDLASDPKEFATNFHNANKLGSAEKNNGLAVVVFLQKKGSDGNAPTVAISVGSGIEGILNDAKVGRFLDKYYVPARKDGKWEEGLITTVKQLHQYLLTPDAAEFQDPPFDPTWTIVAIIFIVLFLGCDGLFFQFQLTLVLLSFAASALGGGGGASGGGSSR